MSTFAARFAELNAKLALRVGSGLRLSIYEMLLSMVSDGLPLDACLRRLHERKASRKRPEALILARWANEMANGKRFSEAIVGDVPAQELVLIAAGERANDLAAGLEQAVVVTKARQKMTAAVIAGIAYPAMLLAMLAFMLIGYSLKLAPEMAKMLPPAEWGGAGSALYRLSEFVATGWHWSLAGMAVLAIGVMVSLGRWTGRGRGWLDRLPPWSIYRTYSGATFLIALSALLRSGVALADAMKYLRANASPWVSGHLALMQSRVRAGNDYGEAMNTGLLDDETSDQVMIYAQVSNFDQAILSIGARSIERGIKRIDSQFGVVRNICLVLIGVSIAWIYSTNLDVQQKIASRAGQAQHQVGAR